MIGTILKHRYEVLEKIGEGNLFAVYKCEDKIENRTVAVKVLLPQYASNRLFAERILIEAQAMVGVSHPGIVEVYDTGEANGIYFVVIEFVRGADLRERIRRNAPFSLTTTVEMGMALCDVLDFAHKQGLIHGDLRPAKVLVTPEGHIKIGDFWVGNAVASSQTIRTTAMMRSVHYMSPEVAEAQPATQSSDIYSLGVMLFEVSAGTLPYNGDTPIAIAVKHARDPIPSVRELNAGVPRDFEAIITKALQKAPSDRYKSAKAMFTDLKAVDDGVHLPHPVVPTKPLEEKKAPEPVAPYEEEEDIEIVRPEPAYLSAIKKTLIAIILLITLGIGILLITILNKPQDVKVPNLVGKKLEDAQKLARQYKLQTDVKTEQPNEEYPAGTVYMTDPESGRSTKSGNIIELWISKGSKYATVPDLVKLDLDSAKTRASDAGLSITDISQDYNTDIPAGSIISQSPAPGTKVERTISMKVTYSLGPKPDETAPADTEGNVDTGTADTSAPSSAKADETRSFDVKFKVPKGPDEQKVEIAVQDTFGENIVYSTLAKPGDRIEQTVQGVGNKITIRIYIDGKLAREDKKWR